VTPLIVGAGPVGLFLAGELRRRGIPARLVERDRTLSRESRALAIHARTLEVLDQTGLADRFLAAGRPLHALVFHRGARPLQRLDLTEIPSRYRCILCLPQSATERLLHEHLRAQGGEIEWGTELVGLEDRGGAVQVRLRRDDGTEEVAEAPWVVGCDGTRSPVREAAGIGLRRQTLDIRIALADLRLEGLTSEDAVRVHFRGRRLMLLIPLPEPGVWRIAGPVGPEVERPDAEWLTEQLRSMAGDGIEVRECLWASVFQVRQQVAATFRRGRVLLCGDAAHGHSPLGGQGMNTGLQDVHALAWRLARVCAGADVALLDTWCAEREPVARRLVRATGLGTRAIAAGGPFPWLRDRALALLPRIGPLRRRALRALSEVDIRYRRNAALWSDGRRAPDVEVQGGRLYEVLRDGRFHVLLGSDAPEAMTRFGRGGRIGVHVMGAEAVDVFRSGAVVVRPDGQVGYAGRVETAWRYLEAVASDVRAAQP
jgi:2-polyprenyl-6-methoxyphenol hydroxylase-like FAD-dependent oxidoreductase